MGELTPIQVEQWEEVHSQLLGEVPEGGRSYHLPSPEDYQTEAQTRWELRAIGWLSRGSNEQAERSQSLLTVGAFYSHVERW